MRIFTDSNTVMMNWVLRCTGISSFEACSFQRTILCLLRYLGADFLKNLKFEIYSTHIESSRNVLY